MPRLTLTALALGALTAPAALAQTGPPQAPAPVPITIPAPQDARTPDATMPDMPDMPTTTGTRSCGGARQVTS